MALRRSLASILVVISLSMIGAQAQAWDDNAYPDWKGQWIRRGGITNSATWDPDKPWGLKQDPPLIPEYQKIFEDSVADQRAGGQGNDPSWLCVPTGMPRLMLAVQPMEIIITPETTYMTFEIFSSLRRIYTDGRDWPEKIEPTFAGYSIGHWEDTDGDGRFDTLVVETRAMKGPHSYDNSGLPLHKDGQAVVKERIYTDKTNPNVILADITTYDNALTRPWTVHRSFRRIQTRQPLWSEYICNEDNHHVKIGDQHYIVSGDGFLMPVKKGQPAPDLKYFEEQK